MPFEDAYLQISSMVYLPDIQISLHPRTFIEHIPLIDILTETFFWIKTNLEMVTKGSTLL